MIVPLVVAGLLAFTFALHSLGSSSAGVRIDALSDEALLVSVLNAIGGDPVGAQGQEPVRFEGHQVWRVAIASLTDLARISTLQEQVPTLDYWTDPRIGRHGVDIRVAGSQGAQESLAAYLDKFQLGYEVFIPDVQDAIDTQLSQGAPIPPDRSSQHPLMETADFAADPTKAYFTKYHNIEETNEYLFYMSAAYPDRVELFSIGETYEGRKQWGVHIRAPGSSIGGPKKEFVFWGGHHAREWIGPAVVQYIMTELVVQYGKDDTLTNALDSFDFTIIPVLNVDGYEYTHSTNRMWRKNRQPNAGNACVGTDPNRNWDTNWGGDGSTSRNPCSDSFIGSAPFSAPEPKNMANYLSSRGGDVISLIDFHAYSQL
ncbi:corticosteroid- binding protein, partial [Podochytrium sp. JEL0797]